ncbi:hypothetical protein, partial [Streptomyces sp. CHA3]|uniref:hypothetical protein n=1 Tax=Streptomyces sp. CHA3 TaxID=2841669 RepID=UPI0020954B93
HLHIVLAMISDAADEVVSTWLQRHLVVTRRVSLDRLPGAAAVVIGLADLNDIVLTGSVFKHSDVF